MSETHLQNLSDQTMKLLEMLIDCSLAAVAIYLIFPLVVGVATTSPTVVAAFAGAGAMLAMWDD